VIKKSLCTSWLQYGKLQVMFKVSYSKAADRQSQGDTRLTLTPSVIPNSNHVLMVSVWYCLQYFCMFFLYFNHQVHRDFLITQYMHHVVISDHTLCCSLYVSTVCAIFYFRLILYSSFQEITLLNITFILKSYCGLGDCFCHSQTIA
jgi:hypothetical protein